MHKCSCRRCKKVVDAGQSRDVTADTGAKVPIWGFSSSPLVAGDVVVVAAAGTLIGYDRATGEPRWFGPDGGESYSSPQRADWHDIVCWRGLVKSCEHLAAGDRVAVAGKLRSQDWPDSSGPALGDLSVFEDTDVSTKRQPTPHRGGDG